MKLSIVDRLLGHRTQIWGLDISADGSTVASGSGHGGHVLTWSLAGAEGWELDGAGIQRFAVMDDSRILCLRDSAKDVELYDPIRETLEPAGNERFVEVLLETGSEPIAASPNAKWIVTPEGNTLVVWNVLTAERVRTLSHQSGRIAQAALWPALFSPDSRFLVTVGKDSEVCLWRSDDWTSEVLCEPVSRTWGIAFAADSRRVAIVDGNRFIRVFDLTAAPLQMLEVKEGGEAYSVAFSTNGRYLATGHQDAVIRIWDLETKEKIASLEGHVQGIFSLSFSPDDRTLASACASATVKLWHVDTWQRLMSVEADAAGVQFTPDGRCLVAMVRKSGSDVFRGERAGLRVLKPPTLQEIDATLTKGQLGPNGGL